MQNNGVYSHTSSNNS